MPADHSTQITWFWRARSVRVSVVLSLGKSLLHWSIGEVTPIEFCFCFLMLEKLSNGEQKYWNQTDSLYASLLKVQGIYCLFLCC